MNNVVPINNKTDIKTDESPSDRMNLIEDHSNTSNKRWVACLVKVAKDQDRNAFSYLYNHFSPKLKSFFMQRGVVASSAEELIQDTFITIWQKAHYYSAEKSYVSTWIYTIARNKKLDGDRKNMRHINYVNSIEDDEPKLSLDDPYEYSASSELQNLISELPEPQPKIMQCIYFEGKSHQATADEMNLTIGTVKGQIRSAITRLKHLTRSNSI